MPKVLVISATDLAPELGQTIVWSSEVQRLVASTPDAAIEAARSFVPSLVVVDASDPREAASLIGRLRRSTGTRRSSIAVLLRQPGGVEDDLLGAGANLVVSMPIDAAECDARLEKLFTVSRRLRTRLPIAIECPGGTEPTVAQLVDISITGMLVEMDPAPPVGTAVGLCFTLPGDAVELRAPAQVVRIAGSAPWRVGLRFTARDDEVAGRIERLLTAEGPEKAFGRYEVLGPVGEGSMGRVFRAFDPLARRVVAIKTLRPELLGGAEGEEHARRFEREAQAAARLVHPHIVTIFDVGEDYFVMELLEGATLQALLRDRGRLPPEDALRILGPVAEALDYAHSTGTIHRDVKPGNIMVLADGRPKVMDFGVAHLTSGAITASGQTFGSPSYMAPEQIVQSAATPQTDLFSLGVVAYEALTGRRPFAGDGVTPILYKVVNQDPPPPTTLAPELPGYYDAVFSRALAKDPSQRFTDAASFVAALAGVPVAPPIAAKSSPSPSSMGEGPVEAPAETIDLKTSPFSLLALRSRPRLRAALAVTVIALGVLVAVASRPRTEPPPPLQPGLQVSTEPAGATVLLDGVAKGTAPLSLSGLRAGRHKVRVEQSHFAPAELEVDIRPGPPVPLRFTLQPLSATLEIGSVPPGVAVRVDGQRVGVTPLSGFRVPPGAHQVVLEEPGFRPWSQVVQAEAGVRLDLSAELVPEGPSAAGRQRDGMKVRGWVRRGDLVGLGPGVTPPRRLAGAAAAYPAAARASGLKGTVSVELTVTEEGKVVDPRVVESAGEVLDEALLEAVRGWRYEPAESNGVEVRVRIRESQVFGPLEP